MTRHSFTPIRALMLVLIATLAVLPLAPVSATESAPSLLMPALGKTAPATQGDWVLRARPVHVDFQAFDRSTAANQRLTIELFDGLVATAVLDRVEKNRSGSRTWIGHLEGHPENQILFVKREQVLVGTIRIGDLTYQIEHGANGQHRLEEVNASLLPDEIAPHQPSPAELGNRLSPFGPEGAPDHDSGMYYDLLVVYTAQASNVAGSAAAAESRIELGVAETNLSYERSQVRTRINLVGMEEIAYTESGSASTERNRLQNPSDGFMDDVHTMRDAMGADIVTLIISNPGCGIAYIQSPVSPSFEAFGFNVTMYACISPNYTFAHEIGHLQSARHDWTVDPTNNSPWTFNHGYFPPTLDWRTIMSYSNGCSPCTRQLWWSNPNVIYPPTGQVMGIPEGQPNAAHNAEALNRTAFVVANFRPSQTEVFGDTFDTGDMSRWDAVVTP